MHSRSYSSLVIPSIFLYITLIIHNSVFKTNKFYNARNAFITFRKEINKNYKNLILNSFISKLKVPQSLALSRVEVSKIIVLLKKWLNVLYAYVNLNNSK